jgi:hypothetical protein
LDFEDRLGRDRGRGSDDRDWNSIVVEERGVGTLGKNTLTSRDEMFLGKEYTNYSELQRGG